PNIQPSGINSAKLDTLLERYAKALRKNPEDIIETDWENEMDSTLNIMIGIPPKSFTYDNKKYTPLSLAKNLGLNQDDYIQLTSFNHHPYYDKFCLESRFNWSYSLYYNVPLDEFISTIDSALSKGYSVALNTDVSGSEFETGFLRGYIINNKTEKITQDIRQKAFETGYTTVDHIMHIIGMAIDEKNQKFYIVKNSWGSFYRDGYLYLSESYIREMGVSILVNKSGLPATLKSRF
ncbi:MAG: aminopeptidase, partial [Ferruginibacter sp.]|nr:aminopeptidase [Ferruginibacter sp.]